MGADVAGCQRRLRETCPRYFSASSRTGAWASWPRRGNHVNQVCSRPKETQTVTHPPLFFKGANCRMRVRDCARDKAGSRPQLLHAKSDFKFLAGWGGGCGRGLPFHPGVRRMFYSHTRQARQGLWVLGFRILGADSGRLQLHVPLL